ncbi:TPA: hypothetical protein R4216_002578 [Citrobacter freundii]|nr:hypothetical protein [Citrobacter freundii]HED3837788.1 hypothetical protein [Citrobacter freundii]HED3843493.1 hypothetical protein [Citrobacter freundii]
MRELNADYLELTRFISEYKIPYSESDSGFNIILKKMHKRYYSFLSLHHELSNSNYFLSTLSLQHDNVFKHRVNEVLSELGTIFFLSLHGCYKAAKLVMRSCIENFSKAIGSLLDINIVNETSVYRVIEIALSHPVFESNALLEKHFIQEKYSMLCADVHTASLENMQHIECIGSFPVFSLDGFSVLAEIYVKLINSMASILIKIAPSIYHKAHHTHKDAISSILSVDDKRLIHQL